LSLLQTSEADQILSGMSGLNGTQQRQSNLDGDHLTLSAVTAAPDGIETVSTLVWKRAPGNPNE
jgi:hypothetical protein